MQPLHIILFDSGIGGLSIFHEIFQQVPSARYTYICDNGFAPYGNKTPEQLQARIPQLFNCLPDHAATMSVIACNTASTIILPTLRARLAMPVVGVVPGIKPAASMTRSQVISVLATPMTIAGAYLQELIATFAPHCQVVPCGSIGLVALAEAKMRGEAIALDAVRAELSPLTSHPLAAEVDTVVLGCTHFPFLAAELKACLPATQTFVNPAPAIAKRVLSLLPPFSPSISDKQENHVYLTAPPPARLPWEAAFRRHHFHKFTLLPPS